MKSETTIKVDLAHPSIGTRVEAMQGDGNTRCITVQLLDDGKPWHPPANAEIAVAYTQPGGTRGFYNQLPDGSPAVRVNGSRVTFLLASAMLRVPGKVSAAVVFNNPQLDQLTSFPFTVTVTESPYVGAQQAEDYIRLQWLEDKLDEWVQQMMSTEKAVAAAAAAERADAAAVNAQEQAAAAGSAATAANTAAALANQAKTDAETAASDAASAAVAANTAAGAAQARAAAAEEAAANANAAALGADAARDAANSAAASANEAAAAAQRVVETIAPDVQQLKQTVATHGEALDNRIKKFYTNNLGATSIADSDDGAIRNLVVYGKSEQGAGPSPENPQEIKSVANPVMKVNGKNLLNPNLETVTRSGITCTNNGDGTYTLSGTSTANETVFILQTLKIPFSKVRITGCPKGGVLGVSYSILIQNTNTWETYVDLGNGVNLDIQSNINYRISIYIFKGYSFDNVTFKPMITTDLNAMYEDFEPYYKEQAVEIPFVLNGIGNVRDELRVYADGSGTLVRRYPAVMDSTKTVTEQALEEPIVTSLTANQVKALFDLRTYYGGTNISFQSDNGVEPVVNFDYACSLENFVEYIKAAQGDDRKFIYDMDDRMTDAEYMAAMAYVNSEYAAALTELEG